MGESVQETLLREFVEETGLIIKIGKLLAVENDYHTFQEKFCQSVFIFYSVSLVSGQLTGSNGEDVAETRFMSESEITDKLILPVHFPLIKKHLCP
jgi:ADP-ribose pyrophosphatase YjhB (NUDIX family)